jgi:hypothetical protein
VRARLAHRGYAASGTRVLRLMRAHSLLAPRRLGPPNGNPAHDGTITTERPDVMWGTDGTRFYTEQDGWCWFFGGRCGGKPGDRVWVHDCPAPTTADLYVCDGCVGLIDASREPPAIN